jgi:hypothetical protein
LTTILESILSEEVEAMAAENSVRGNAILVATVRENATVISEIPAMGHRHIVARLSGNGIVAPMILM